MIHDFDMAVFLMAGMPETMATGSVLVDPRSALGDFDSASAVLRWATGSAVDLKFSAAYGYDQRRNAWLKRHGGGAK